MKIYAKQVPPEYQESPLSMGEWPENVFVFGNRDYIDKRGRLEAIAAGLEAIADIYQDMQQGTAHTNNLHAAIWYELPRDNGAGYTRAERLRIVELAFEYAYSLSWSDAQNTLCETLEIITGRDWEYATIRGSAQGEWNCVIYPAEYGHEWLCDFETEYFNTGAEWRISENDPDGDDNYYFYSHSWSDDAIRAEIADAAGVDPCDVILYAFNGWSRSPVFKEV